MKPDTVKPDSDPRVEALLELLGGGGDKVRGLFALIEIAEEEIGEARRRHPLAEFAIQKSFEILTPDAGLFPGRNPEVYRAHCRELLARVAAGASKKELQLGTRAEVLCVMSGLSFEHPPGPQGSAMMSTIFDEIFPGVAQPDGPIPEPWPGATEELLGAFQRKIERSTSR